MEMLSTRLFTKYQQKINEFRHDLKICKTQCKHTMRSVELISGSWSCNKAIGRSRLATRSRDGISACEPTEIYTMDHDVWMGSLSQDDL